MKITLKGTMPDRHVWLNGKKLNPADSQAVMNHSPDGFSWGYNSSTGVTQLALAVCMELYGDIGKKPIVYLWFRRAYIEELPFNQAFNVELEVPGNHRVRSMIDKYGVIIWR